MKNSPIFRRGKLAMLVALALVFSTAGFAQNAHPAYLHALSDLRAARWLINFNGSNGQQQSADERAAIGAIDAAIMELKKASIDDGKDLNDHPPFTELHDRASKLQKALELLRATRGDVNQKEDERFAQGLKGRALIHIDDAIKATNNAITAVPPAPQAHPAYLKALSDLRASRWLINFNGSNGQQQSADERAAIGAIDAAIMELKKASIDDGKDLNDHPPFTELHDRASQLQKALEMLRATRADVNQREDNVYATGLKARALIHIDDAIKAANNAVAAGAPAPPQAHPAYLQALSDLRAARWLIDHRPGNWQQSKDEAASVGAIDAAIAEIKKASIDDGKNLNDHPQVQEIPDRGGRLHKALELLNKTRADVNQREDDRFAQGLKARALQHIDNAIKACDNAIRSK